MGSAATACASRSKRAQAVGSCGERPGSTLIATSRSEPRVAGAVDLAHAARAERTGDAVGTEASAGRDRHG